MFIGLFIACALLIKTSLLGLGGVSILLGLAGVIVCALAKKITKAHPRTTATPILGQ